MRNRTVFLLVLLIVGTCIAGYAMLIFTAPKVSQEQMTQAAPPMTPEETNQMYMIIGVIVGIGFVLWVIQKMREAEILIPVFTLLVGLILVFGVGYFITLGDKNGDGVSDSQIIRVVQPVGNNAELDSQYSDINSTNTKSNLATTMSIIGLVVVLLIAFVVLTGVGVTIHFISKIGKL